jgi:ADP-ribose pyrophosphatase
MVPLRDDGVVLMVRQFRLAAGGVLLEIPAGTLEAGEEPAACAARELVEETGFAAESLRPLFSAYLAPGYTTELIHAFLATGLTPASAHTDEDENLELVEIPLADVEGMIARGEIRDAKSISSLMVAARLVETGS